MIILMTIEKQEQMDKITNAVCDAIIIGNFFLYKRNRIYDLQEKEKQRTYS